MKVVVETDVGIVLVTVNVETGERKKLNVNYHTVWSELHECIRANSLQTVL